ncbi:Hypothetical predicted protein [Olea europaea subsp. europaea]|uniref:Uncharacterized protein n=1 Tax=Olea europaea subsp. europaea TaxID=158383 RepID=A0A8S0SXI4_OLEEU|nr:Hypothetical predicted protein [Olea europaea subsp. europaea]
MRSADRIETEANIKQIVDMDTMVGFCIVAKHLPNKIPEKKEIRMRRVGVSVNVVGDHDSEWVRLILEEVGGASDGSWNVLPYLFATFMTSTIWNTTAFNVDTGGFSNNVHCLVHCFSDCI